MRDGCIFLGLMIGILSTSFVFSLFKPYDTGYREAVVECKTTNIKCQAVYDKYIADMKYKEAMSKVK
jgi:hypothetical protein